MSVIAKEIKCVYYSVCRSANGKVDKCSICKHNTLRNKVYDFFEEANDNPIPEKCPKLSYSGPAEQTAGYKCPVCGTYTNPYHLDDKNRCCGCGYELNV